MKWRIEIFIFDPDWKNENGCWIPACTVDSAYMLGVVERALQDVGHGTRSFLEK